jgi:hypothetical protein
MAIGLHSHFAQIGSFLPSPDRLLSYVDTKLKNLMLELIRSAKHIHSLKQLESNSILEVTILMLERIMEDGCTYVRKNQTSTTLLEPVKIATKFSHIRKITPFKEWNNQVAI